MKIFYIFYTINGDSHKSMAVAVSETREDALNSVQSRLKEHVRDGDIQDYHTWWIEELNSNEKQIIVP